VKPVATLFASAFVLAGQTGVANAQICSQPWSQPVFCSDTQGCSEYKTIYYCQIYGSPQDTCHCWDNVQCCGEAVGPGLMPCSAQCAGCGIDGDEEPTSAEPEEGGRAPLDTAGGGPEPFSPRAVDAARARRDVADDNRVRSAREQTSEGDPGQTSPATVDPAPRSALGGSR